MLSKRNGFTLIELLIVMAIIGVLAALVGPKMFNKVDDSRVKATKVQISNLETALSAYRLDVGHFPERLDALRENIERSNNWAGPYLPKAVPADSWGNPFVYKSSGKNGEYEITSYGADGRLGGTGQDADINSND